MDPRWTQDEPKMNPRWTQDEPKMDSRWTQDGPKVDPKWTQDGPKRCKYIIWVRQWYLTQPFFYAKQGEMEL